MKPVYQTRFGKTDGNCLAACLASIFEVHIDSIPDFGTTDSWYDKFKNYMVETFDLQPADSRVAGLNGWKPRGYHLISGRSPRYDCDHSIVGLSGKPIHDPFPDGDCELESYDNYTIFVATLI